jgi:FkbM family methyltransferase
MYSQRDEEPHILGYFGSNVGRFIDIGAYDGKSFSNTLALLERGWSGVMIEPSPSAFIGLLQNTAPHADRVTLLNVAVHATGGLIQFYDSGGDALSTFSQAHREKWAPIAKMRPMLVNALPIADLWDKFRAEFINLDVEGYNWELFERLPWAWDCLQMVCVEYDTHSAQMQALAAAHGFRLLHRTGENLILVRS